MGGNWKCNGSVTSVTNLVAGLNKLAPATNVDVCVTPSTLHLRSVQDALRADFLVGAQNCSRTDNGAFTGETSAEMLRDANIPYVILGHSERRSLYGEADAVVAEKVSVALKKGLRVVACIGETLQEREQGRMLSVLTRQTKAIADAVAAAGAGGAWGSVVLAYEPVWAIGTGVVATSAQAQEAQQQLREWIAANYGKAVAEGLRIIYGGSVKPKNAAELIACPDIDGFLVGGASLKASDFGQIIGAVASRRSRL